MRYSGVTWIGDIPDNWNLIRFKDLYRSIKEIAGANSSNYERLALTLNGVVKRNKDDSEGLQPKEFDTYQILKENDFVFKMIDLQNFNTSRVGLSPYTGLVSPAYLRFSPKNDEQYNKFTYYYFMSMYYNHVFNSLGGNGVRSALNASDMGNLICPFPEESVQEEIVNFIEGKCLEIDELIGVEKRQIENLLALRQSIISKVITKGIHKKELISTGVDYIGSIANDRSIINLKYLLNEPMMYGANESGQRFSSGCYRYIRITDISNDGKLKDTEDNLYLPEESGKDFALFDGDILFARSGGTVGKTFIYRKAYGKCAFAGYLIKARCNSKLLPEYLYYFTQSTMYELWKNRIFIQATIQNIGANKYSNMPVVYCNINEQQMVVEVLRKKCAEIDELIEIKTKKINQLADYKNSLIYEYVTGKKEVGAK